MFKYLLLGIGDLVNTEASSFPYESVKAVFMLRNKAVLRMYRY